MPTSATGISATDSGFTLLEVLVTLVLIGIVTTFAVMQIPGEPAVTRVATAARRLQQFVTRQRDEATLSGSSRGIRCDLSGCRALRLEHSEWHSISGSHARYRVPAGIHIALQTDGQPVALKSSGAPQIVLAASGETSAFQLSVRATAADYRLTGDVAGHFAVTALR